MKDIKHYKELKYRMIVEFYPEDNTYFVRFPDLPGCIADGKTPEKAIKKALIVKDEWIEIAIESGWKIKEPSVPIESSGRITLRLPKSIHEKLVDKTEQEDVSLNQLILTYIAEGLERHSIKENIENISENITKGLNRIECFIQQNTVQNTDSFLLNGIGFQENMRIFNLTDNLNEFNYKNKRDDIWQAITINKDNKYEDSGSGVSNS